MQTFSFLPSYHTHLCCRANVMLYAIRKEKRNFWSTFCSLVFCCLLGLCNYEKEMQNNITIASWIWNGFVFFAMNGLNHNKNVMTVQGVNSCKQLSFSHHKGALDFTNFVNCVSDIDLRCHWYNLLLLSAPLSGVW